jgi:transcriptional antiterminator RfaH
MNAADSDHTGMREHISAHVPPADTAPVSHTRAPAKEPVLLRWFAVLTKPAGEQVAQVNLERQGFRVYCPRLLRPLFQRGRWVERIVPLFPRYLFVQLDLACQSLAPVRSTLGVASLVRFGAEPKAVPNSIVDSLVDRADPESGLHRLNSDRALTRGTRVNVVAGAFEGLDGIFDREAGEDRAVVLLQLLGRLTPVGIPSRFVVASVA